MTTAARKACAAAGLCFMLAPSAFAAEEGKSAPQDKFGHGPSLGINYPGVDARLFLSDSFAAELRGQYMDRIFTAGARAYYYPFTRMNDGMLRPFIAAECDYLTFRGSYSKGEGAAFGGLAGVEYFLSRSISVQTDAGPYYIALKDEDSSIAQSGLEFVLNFTVNFYF